MTNSRRTSRGLAVEKHWAKGHVEIDFLLNNKAHTKVIGALHSTSFVIHFFNDSCQMPL